MVPLGDCSRSAKAVVAAARDGDLERLTALLDAHMWPPHVLSQMGQASGYTALGLACNRGRCEVVELLLQRGASPNMPICENGAMPLMISVVWNHPKIVKLLLRHGAALETAAVPRAAGPCKNCTALEVAQQRGRTECASLIVTERAQLRFQRLRRVAFHFGHALLAFQELYAEIHHKPGGEGEKLAKFEFYETARAGVFG